MDDFALRSSTKKGLVPRAWCKECDIPQGLTPEANRRKALMARYGLTPDEFAKMGEAQSWRCAICDEDITEGPYIDHNHVTGKVRKLLCMQCNLGLGHFRDSVDNLLKAVCYLEREN